MIQERERSRQMLANLGEVIRAKHTSLMVLADAADMLGLKSMADRIEVAMHEIQSAYTAYRDADSAELDADFQDSQRQVGETLLLLLRKAESAN